MSEEERLSLKEYDDAIDAEEDIDADSCNTQKSLIPMYVRDILQACTNKNRPITQQKIIKKLADHPYEVEVNRKTVSRVLNTLIFYNTGVMRDKRGYYYDGR